MNSLPPNSARQTYQAPSRTQPSFSRSFLLLRSTSSLFTSSSVGTRHRMPSPASPGNSIHSLCVLLGLSSMSSPSTMKLSQASLSLAFSYASNVPSSSSRL
ncbi:hypothetical protein CUC08_Gglean012746 [Alternaria sp. MG1]|nr:hypothetical protein CUC08_Gglean012746 [Alternaria sp. MG1]